MDLWRIKPSQWCLGGEHWYYQQYVLSSLLFWLLLRLCLNGKGVKFVAYLLRRAPKRPETCKSTPTSTPGMMLHSYVLLLSTSFISLAAGACHYQSPAFPPPAYTKPCPELLEAFGRIEASVSALVTDPSFNTSSYSIEVTSAKSTLWATFHTAADKDPVRPGAEEVNGNSTYRIASITKAFTVLGILQQQAAGNLSLDDTVDKYIPHLGDRQNGTIPWKDITLRSLASQLSGLPRDWAQGDLVTELSDPSAIGLPPATLSGLPHCDSFGSYRPCTEQELLQTIQSKPPLFAPNQKSTYSNIAFELLGLVLTHVTGVAYEDYVQTAILGPLAMTGTSFTKPSDSVAVLPKNVSWYWDVDEGAQNPTGGLYASSSDMSKFLRYVLSHFNGITHTLNWLQPASFTAGLNSFYGVPWEIFRTNRILDHPDRVVTIATKGGGLPGYVTNILLVPEYELGITILTAGNETLLAHLIELVTVPLIQAVDQVAQRQINRTYTGTYRASGLNSSVTLSYSGNHGLEISDWISNGTEMLTALPKYFHIQGGEYHAQLMPTLLFRDQDNQAGELWRILILPGRSPPHKAKVWDDFCISDVDTLMYAGQPLNELVFWDPGQDGRFDAVELTAFRISMTRDRREEIKDKKLSVQEL
ncbi:hypothetical protein A1O3_09802 [Capronia epimyces CBS 606.96]|uniref:Uncharacterized protein n=1 Tax=Capronia epimyces CBS 606.96 TaxID=1182542 RepID=W9XJQ0_9EURO|nr:uncharacterized protein A1O3_09802 [Capronia epimyces CBS 606.96]EXJ77575.1 hypothetical protein A1O3_09802 [Capronia epimyces CBS 606.96]